MQVLEQRLEILINASRDRVMSGRPLSFLSLLNDSMAQAVFHRHRFGYAVAEQSWIIRTNTQRSLTRSVDVHTRGSAHKLRSLLKFPLKKLLLATLITMFCYHTFVKQ